MLDKRALDDWIQREPYVEPCCVDCEAEVCLDRACPVLLKFYKDEEEARRRIEGE